MSAAARRVDRFSFAESRHTSALPKASPQAQPRTLMPNPTRDSWNNTTRNVLIRDLDLQDGRNVIFHGEMNAQIRKELGEYHYSIESLDIHASGATREAARLAAAKVIWEEADRWLHAPSHTLSDAEMERKGLVLSHVDVVKSRIARRPRKSVSVLGQIVRDADGSLWFRESVTEGRRFAFDPELAKNLPNDNYLRIGKRRTGEFGEPVGPIVELGEPLDTEDETAT